MANFEIINKKLVPTAINNIIIKKSSDTNAIPNKKNKGIKN
jgi:hypothetical protein